MWLSPKIFSILEVSKDSVDALREELASVRAERDALSTRITSLQTNFDWLRMQWNQMQAENKALLERAYGVRVPVPELINRTDKTFTLQDMFSDIGDDEARQIGLPSYDNKN